MHFLYNNRCTKHNLLHIVVSLTVFVMIMSTLSGCYNIGRSEQAKKLFNAIRNDDLETVDDILITSPELINEYEIIEIGNNYAKTQTPLTLACQYRNFEMVELLVSNNADVNKPSKNLSIKPLSIALYNNDYEIAEFLIENGADISSEDFYDFVPFAIVKNKIDGDDILVQQKRLELMKKIVTPEYSNSEISKKYSIQFIFQYAIESNSVLVSKYFLDNKMFDVNERLPYKNQTSLIVATKEKSYESCKLLLEYNADKTIEDSSGKTAYDYAVELGDEYLISMLA